MTRLPILFYLAVTGAVGTAQEFHPSIPRAWSDSETTSFELPLAQADRSPRYPSAHEYYNMPVRPVYRTYPFYAPDREPAGYWESLQQKEPEVVFDPAKLKTKEDWIRAGKLVFAQPVVIAPAQREWRQANFRAVPMPTTPEGIVPGLFHIVRKKGVVELGASSCAGCHVRVMPDGSVVSGAQSNLPDSEAQAWRYTDRGTGPDVVQRYRVRKRSLFSAPWAANQDHWDQITLDEIVRRTQAMPPGVVEREGASSKHPARIPSLIGIADLRYLDATGLSRNRNIGDLMRYMIVNQGLISVAHYGDFYPNAETKVGSDYRCLRGHRSGTGARNAPRHRLLQGSFAARGVDAERLRTRGPSRKPRRVVRPRPPERRLRAQWLPPRSRSDSRSRIWDQIICRGPEIARCFLENAVGA
jgi:hypothetical protein